MKFILSLALICALLSCDNPVASGGEPPILLDTAPGEFNLSDVFDEIPSTEGSAEMTLLMYFGADDDRSETERALDVRQDLLEASLDTSVRLLCLFDFKQQETDHWDSLLVLDAVNRIQYCLSEFSSSEQESLEMFLTWGLNYAPSDRYSLVISSHGSGIWRTMKESDGGTRLVMDSSNNGDTLNALEIESALSNGLANSPVDKIDLTIINTCLGGAYELGYSLSGLSSYFIGNETTFVVIEDSSGRIIHAFDFGEIIEYIKDNSSLDTLTLAQWIIAREDEKFALFNQSEAASMFCAGLYDLDEIEVLMRSLDDLGTYLRNDSEKRLVAQELRYELDYPGYGQLDLKGYLKSLEERFFMDSDILPLVQGALGSLEAVLIDTAEDYPSINGDPFFSGMSIFIPDTSNQYNVWGQFLNGEDINYTELKQAREGGGWSAFVQTFPRLD